MARQALFVLALIFFAAMGMASAASHAAAPAANTGDAPDPFDETVVGNNAGSVDAAPIGGPVPPGAFPDVPTATAPSPNSGAVMLDGAAIVGAGVVAAVAGSFFI
ncbi:hypothetical protein F511_12414 [Dorcoceras hygrometricum]|uniref:Anther-specific protein BCP1-like n=1 Tax=Dorcoceras hygrometricum TaxID=472368 RepID=A0A2Z7BZV6_9LAMI|nr:hypothetical protein F511_12414 [Dorcoceras hygrometricum]